MVGNRAWLVWMMTVPSTAHNEQEQKQNHIHCYLGFGTHSELVSVYAYQVEQTIRGRSKGRRPKAPNGDTQATISMKFAKELYRLYPGYMQLQL